MKKIYSAVIVFAVFLTGCATSVNLEIQRPPALNTLGIQRLAVMPFTTSDNSSLQNRTATLLANEALLRIQATRHFTIVDSNEVSRLQRTNENLENYVDALFNGQVISLTVNNTSRRATRINRETGREVPYTIYDREVVLSFNYSLTRTRDRSFVGVINKSGRRSDSNEDRNSLRSAEDMIQSIITETMRDLGSNIAPHTVVERRSFMREESRDRAIRDRTKYALDLFKAGNYRGAQEAYLGIYYDTQSFAAAYNASLIIMAQGNINAAANLMERVYRETGNPRAATELARIQRMISDAGMVATYRENQIQRDRLIALMVNTLSDRMPVSARVAVINNSRSETELADTVVNGIISGLLSRNITVVDRNNQSLLAAERNYQLSGNVSDADLVSIGNEAGVNTFVLIAISGYGANRRLVVRMLDVERNTVLYQSPPTDEMNL